MDEAAEKPTNVSWWMSWLRAFTRRSADALRPAHGGRDVFQHRSGESSTDGVARAAPCARRRDQVAARETPSPARPLWKARLRQTLGKSPISMASPRRRVPQARAQQSQQLGASSLGLGAPAALGRSTDADRAGAAPVIVRVRDAQQRFNRKRFNQQEPERLASSPAPALLGSKPACSLTHARSGPIFR